MAEQQVLLDPRGAISHALEEILALGGPEMDLMALAEETRVPVQRLQWFDAGCLGAVDIDQLERLCRILGRSPNDLLGYEADL
jgi:DNA-binding Xre family transcriptional regulator